MTGSLTASCTDLYATATPLRQITANPDIASRGAAYGMRSVAVDGNDVVAVAEAAHGEPTDHLQRTGECLHVAGIRPTVFRPSVFRPNVFRAR